MLVVGLIVLEPIDVLHGLLLDLSFRLPEVLVLGQVTRINCHLNDLSVGLELPEDVHVELAAIVDVLQVFVLLFGLPLAKGHLFLQDLLGRNPIVSLLNGPPLLLRD